MVQFHAYLLDTKKSKGWQTQCFIPDGKHYYYLFSHYIFFFLGGVGDNTGLFTIFAPAEEGDQHEQFKLANQEALYNVC